VHREYTGRDHVLLTVLGTNSRPALYALEERRSQAVLAPLALLELLPEANRPDRLFAVCTPQAADETWPILVEELKRRNEGCEPKRIDVPSPSNQADVYDFLQRVAGAIPESTELTVDVTHGFRHHSFLTYLAVQYLTTLHDVQVHGAYYGLLGQGPDGASPFLDLRPLLELPRWTHALKVLGDTGSAMPMARAIRGEPLIDETPPELQTRQQLADGLERFSEGYLSGLPLELGRQSQLFRNQKLQPLTRLLKRDHGLPLADDLVQQLDKTLESFALTKQHTGDGWKRCVVLSEKELKREARMIDSLIEHGHISTALGLMNEWAVSWAVLRRQHGDSDWLVLRQL
jgi:CRISPR-associated Csx2 family protein